MRGRTPNNETGHIEWENTSVQRGLFFTFRLFPLIRPGLRPVHLPRRGRRPPAGAAYRRGRSLTFPWGKVAASAAGRGAVPGRTLCRPTPVPGCARSTLSQERVCPLTRQGLWPCHPLLRRGFFQAIYASRSESFLTIREVMRNSTATKAKKPHWALVVSEVAMKS